VINLKEIIVSTITLALVSMLVRLIVPRIERLVKWLIRLFVKRAEKKITGSKMGETKKKYVIKRLNAFGVKASSTVSELIDSAVETMNSRGMDLTTTLKDDVTNEISNKIDNVGASITNKLSNSKIE
jgi:hypothetical protein